MTSPTDASADEAARSDARQRPATIADVLGEAFAEHAVETAILSPGRPALTFGQLKLQIQSTVGALAQAGYSRGSRIAVALPDGPEFAAAVLAVSCATTCAPLNDRLDVNSLAQLLRATHADALIVRQGEGSAAERAADQAGIDVIRLRSSATDPAGVFQLVFASRRGRVPVEPARRGDVALVAHTSGTTSTPKIVPFEHWRIAAAASNRSALGHLDRSDRVLILMPLSSMGAIRRSLLLPLASGCAVVCPTVIDGKALVDVLESCAPTQCIASPVTLIAMLEEFERRVPRPRHSLKLIRSSNAELREADRERLERAFGVPVTQVYGMTETGIIAQTPLPPAPRAAGSVGRPAQGVEIAITAADGGMLAAGEIGEIVVRGAEMFAGYENDPESNRAAFRDGWFRTGDSGRIDAQGMLHLSGRIKDIINRGGVKITPREVEDVLLQHPAVGEAAAFAVPHRTLGEDVAAAVVVRDGASATDAELRQFVRGRLSASKVPGRILAVDMLPRGALGKVNRIELAILASRTSPVTQEPPRDRNEEEIAAIFAEVLEIAEVGRQDGFFECGGDSLRGMRVLARVEEAFGVCVTLDVLFDHPRVAEFAAAVAVLAAQALRPGPGGRVPASAADHDAPALLVEAPGSGGA